MVHTLSESATDEVKDYQILANRGYMIGQVVSDTTLDFVANDSIRPYFLEANSNTWVPDKAGVKAGLTNRNQRNIARMSFMLNANSINDIYIRVDVKPSERVWLRFKAENPAKKAVIQ